MIVLAAILIGAVIGDRRAKAAGGGTKDRLQYAAVHAVIAAILAIFATILIDRAMRG